MSESDEATTSTSGQEKTKSWGNLPSYLFLCFSLIYVYLSDVSASKGFSQYFQEVSIAAGRGEDDDRELEDLTLNAPWVPSRPGIYNWSSIPEGLAPTLELLFPPEGSPQSKKPLIIASVQSGANAGGTADRLRGLGAAACLAMLLGRPLAIDPDYLASEVKAENFTADTPWGTGHYSSISGGWIQNREPRDALLKRAQENPDEIQVVSSNKVLGDWCLPPPDDPVFPPISNTTRQVMADMFRICRKVGMFPCSSLFLHASWGHYKKSHQQVDLLELEGSLNEQWIDAIVPPHVDGYAALHMRIGGSSIGIETINGTIGNVAGAPFRDGHKGSANAWGWLSQFSSWSKATAGFFCAAPLVIVTDSSRFISEAGFRLWPAARVATCCSTPIHVSKVKLDDRAGIEAAETQVLFDLITLSRASLVVRTAGNFGGVGMNFLRFDNHQHPRWGAARCSGEPCIKNAVKLLEEQMSCAVAGAEN